MTTVTSKKNDASEKVASFTVAEVEKHNTEDDMWVICSGHVYDVTKFAPQHPGGPEYLVQYAGKDISKAMTEEGGPHEHSSFAFRMMKDFYLGTLEGVTSVPPHVAGEASTAAPDSDREGELNELLRKIEFTDDHECFLDLSKPLLYQMWTCGIDKETYMRKVHVPHHLDGPARIFESDLLEPFSKTFWWVIPMLWLPIVSYLAYQSFALLGPLVTLGLFIVGVLNWTLMEYSLHRFLFHIEKSLPDNRVALTLHFLLHGIHHLIPMDGLRLVMPPVLAATLAMGLWVFHKLVWGNTLVWGVFAGTLFGYVCYDLTHYYLHHGKALNSYLKSIKTHHLDHHYKDFEVGFGISTKLWDVVIGTDFPPQEEIKKKNDRKKQEEKERALAKAKAAVEKEKVAPTSVSARQRKK